LYDSVASMRRMVAWSLGSLRSPAAEQPLEQLLQTESNEDVRVVIRHALRELQQG
jgi:HEAT repeat protein